MKQKMRLSDLELELLKSSFADRDSLLLAIRNVFFGFELSEDEKNLIRGAMTPALLKLLRKQFLPEFQSDLPIAQNIDLFTLVDIRGKTKDQIYQEVEATKVKIELIRIGLERLSHPESISVGLLDFERNDLETELAGRNLFINHVDRQLQTIEVLAGQKTESVEQTKERLLKNSTK